MRVPEGDLPHVEPPTTLADRVDGFEVSVRALIALGRSASPDELARQSACPGWTVQDQLAHVAAVESLLAGDPQPQVDVPDYPWLRSPVGAFIEQGVEARRGRSAAEVLDELETVLPRRLATLRSLDEDAVIRGLLGTPAPAAAVMRMRLTDVWCHEQDVREALERPGGLDTAGAAGFVHVVLDALPRIVAREAGIDPGTSVVVEVTGPVRAVRAVRVEIGADGRPEGVVLARPFDPAATALVMDTRWFTRRGAGRVMAQDCPYAATGDPHVARRVVEALAVTP